MSGFLHQLAARSLGIAPAVRPRAALPYAAPAPEAPAPALAAVAPEPPTVMPAAPLAATWREESGPSPEPAAVSHAVQRAAEPTPASRAPAASAEIPALHSVSLAPIAPRQRPEPDREGDHPVTPHLDHTQLPAGPATPSAHSAEKQAVADSWPASDAPAADLPDLESLISRLVGQATSHHLSSPDGTPSPSAAMVPATGQPPRPGHVSHRPAERREAGETASPTADTAPEVHITIGRLEVNPPSRPTPPPPRPRGPAPLSLGDYLARRAGGRS